MQCTQGLCESNEVTRVYRIRSLTAPRFHGRYNDTRVYIYGGSSFRGNDGFPNKKANFDYSEQHSLFSFDNNTWNSYGTQLSSPSYGAAAEAPDQGLAFYLNGRTDDGSAPSTSNDGDSQTLLDGMHVIDMLQQTEKTLSVTGMNDNQPRVGGALQYVPGLGTDGVLVGLGGRVFDGKPTVSLRDEGRLLGFDSVDVFDISSYLETSQSNGNGTWYSQRTSGSLPQPRIDFCTIITSASDNSSHNIWVYGGRDPNSINGPAFFDETYVLSLPSFHWIKIHQGNKPRWGHTCHLAGGNQMITVGGHNEFENICDWHTTGVGVLDLYRGIWGSMFQARGNDKGLNFKIVNDIGGSSWGDAVKREPEKGWSSKELGNIMNKTRLYDNFSGTITVPGSEAPKEGLRIEAIVIGLASVGAIVFIGSVAYLTFLYCRYRRPGSPTASPKPHHLEEVEGFSKIELPDGEFRMYEANGIDGRHECPGTSARAEADSGNAVTYAAELPCTNFGMGGRWGVPVVRTRRPTLLGGRSESEDAQSWAAGDDQAVFFDMKGCSESIV
jgi:hypothetical protein